MLDRVLAREKEGGLINKDNYRRRKGAPDRLAIIVPVPIDFSGLLYLEEGRRSTGCVCKTVVSV